MNVQTLFNHLLALCLLFLIDRSMSNGQAQGPREKGLHESMNSDKEIYFGK